MTRRAARAVWLFGTLVAAVAAACSSGSTNPPAPCDTYTGGLGGDTIQGTYTLVSLCQGVKPNQGPPQDSGHVTITGAPNSTFVAVFLTQGQPAETINGTYSLHSLDSIIVSGTVSTPLGPQAVQLLGTFALRTDSLYVSGTLFPGPLRISFIGKR